MGIKLIEHAFYLLFWFVIAILSVGGFLPKDFAVPFLGLSFLETVYLSFLSIVYTRTKVLTVRG